MKYDKSFSNLLDTSTFRNMLLFEMNKVSPNEISDIISIAPKDENQKIPYRFMVSEIEVLITRIT